MSFNVNKQSMLAAAHVHLNEITDALAAWWDTATPLYPGRQTAHFFLISQKLNHPS